MTSNPQSRNRVLVIDKVGAILRAFLDNPEETRLVDLTRVTGMTKSNTQRILASLRLAGLVEKDAVAGNYRPGPLVLQLAASATRQWRLTALAEEPLQQLLSSTGQTVYLVVLRDLRAVCVQRLPGIHVDIQELQLGGSMPLYCGATPRLLLASLPDDQVKDYLRSTRLQQVTSNTLTTPEMLFSDVAKTRRQGYTLSIDDVTPGVAAVAAPVFDVSDKMVAAISIADVASNYTVDRLPTFINTVQAAAAEISRRMGSERGKTAEIVPS